MICGAHFILGPQFVLSMGYSTRFPPGQTYLVQTETKSGQGQTGRQQTPVVEIRSCASELQSKEVLEWRVKKYKIRAGGNDVIVKYRQEKFSTFRRRISRVNCNQ
ncbi:hypothetical protein PoB_006817800 [Plakobranchus ocellatus]|uniref:Uncharacterized protein n=1 Tax=Plakobranchus ocellatus TaxID=259542 RepID=A0AAV4DBT5_9GAST|nr:hypothetical protein PoB_006817800 [Plakobranchus ocellatus]